MCTHGTSILRRDGYVFTWKGFEQCVDNLPKETAEIETEDCIKWNRNGRKVRCDQANKRQKPGLVWRNRKKISQIIKDYYYLSFFLLIILWFVPWTNHLWPKCPDPGSHEGTAHNKPVLVMLGGQPHQYLWFRFLRSSALYVYVLPWLCIGIHGICGKQVLWSRKNLFWLRVHGAANPNCGYGYGSDSGFG